MRTMAERASSALCNGKRMRGTHTIFAVQACGTSLVLFVFLLGVAGPASCILLEPLPAASPSCGPEVCRLPCLIAAPSDVFRVRSTDCRRDLGRRGSGDREGDVDRVVKRAFLMFFVYCVQRPLANPIGRARRRHQFGAGRRLRCL